MADNVQANLTTTSGAVFASDEISGVHHSRVKIQTGADGSATDVSTAAPVPVQLSDGSSLQTFMELDLDSGGGTANRVSVGIALPGPGGPVPGGDSTNPVRVDPTGTTTQPTKGQDAHDATVSAPPFVTGGRANTSGDPTGVSADGDVVYTWMDKYGRTIIQPFFPSLVAATGTHGPNVATLTASGDTTVIAAPGSESLHITSITAVNSDGTNDVLLRFKDGGNTRVQSYMLKNAVNNYRVDFNPPWKMTAATALVGNLSASGNVYLTVHFFTAA